MSLRIKTYLIVVGLLLLLSGGNAFAVAKDSALIANDTLPIALREPDPAVQQEIYSDEEWKYVTEPQRSSSEDSFFGRLFQDLIESLFDDMDGPDFGPGSSGRSGFNWWTLFFVLIGAGLLVFFIIKATGAGGNTLFKGKSKVKEKVDARLEDVDIHGIDYDSEIVRAKSRQDYRYAVRLWFLRSLKEMADFKLIDWKIDKTNSDYYYELSGSKLQKEFGSVSLLYDYIWYGDFRIDELKYGDAEAQLQRFHTSIQQAEVKG